MKIWLNVAEAAEYAGLSRDTIYTACEARLLRHVRVGGRRAIRLRREWLDEWFECHTPETVAHKETNAIRETVPSEMESHP